MANEDVQKTLEELSRNLQENKAWLEEAQRVAHVGYRVWDLQTNHLIWSDETYHIFELTPQEDFIGLEKLREMIHPDDREAETKRVVSPPPHSVLEFRRCRPRRLECNQACTSE
jgi:PAS domain-containing protein